MAGVGSHRNLESGGYAVEKKKDLGPTEKRREWVGNTKTDKRSVLFSGKESRANGGRRIEHSLTECL